MKNINMLVFPGVEMLQKPTSKVPTVEDNIITLEGYFLCFILLLTKHGRFLLYQLHTKILLIMYPADMVHIMFLQVQDLWNLRRAKL